jgi:hypothetical protein
MRWETRASLAIEKEKVSEEEGRVYDDVLTVVCDEVLRL